MLFGIGNSIVEADVKGKRQEASGTHTGRIRNGNGMSWHSVVDASIRGVITHFKQNKSFLRREDAFVLLKPKTSCMCEA